jgi:MoaA/NifB/PqqE/SkfB family radical SAM enzyme
MRQPIDSKTFCILPWIHVNASVGGKYRPCCNAEVSFNIDDSNISLTDAFKSSDMNKIRQSMISGDKHLSCKVCYDREDKGGLSFRHTYTEDKFKQFVNEEAHPVIKYLDMRFDSSCNLACRMCDPSSSNQLSDTILWYKENQKDMPNHWKTFKNHKPKDTTEISKKRKDYVLELLPTIEVFKITGGEPFISKDFLDVLDVAISEGYSKNITLLITTNGTKFVDAVLKRLLHFKGLDLNVSVDGINEVYNYIRFPFKWEKWCERFEEFLTFADSNQLYKNLNFRVRTSTVVTAYNWITNPLLYCHLKNYTEKFSWLKAINYIPRIDFNLNLRPSDSELSAKFLPLTLLNEGLENWRKTDYRQVKEFENYVKDAAKITDNIRNVKQKELKYITTTVDLQRKQNYTCLGSSFSNWMQNVEEN